MHADEHAATLEVRHCRLAKAIVRMLSMKGKTTVIQGEVVLSRVRKVMLDVNTVLLIEQCLAFQRLYMFILVSMLKST